MHSVILVDDHAIVREGFKRLIEREHDIAVVGEAASVIDARPLLAAHHPDLLVTDLSLGRESGMALLRETQAHHPATRCVVLSMHTNPAFVAEALSHGARGYVTKGVGAEELVACLRAVLGGQRYLSRDLRGESRTLDVPRTDALTPRELQTLRLLVGGMVPKAAAVELGISEKTLYAHRASLLDKLGVSSDRDIARIAVERGLL